MARFFATLLLTIMTSFAASAQPIAEPQWAGTWAAAAEYTGDGDMPRSSLAQTSVRQVIRISMIGEGTGKKNAACRLQLSNEFGSSPVEIRAVYVADALDSCNIDAKTAHYLAFSNKRSVTIPAGEAIYSDAFSYAMKPLQRLAVTICYGKQVPEHATSHRGSRTTSYIMDGVVKPTQQFKTKEKVDHWYNIAKLETQTTAPAIAILGNSITDGRGSTTNLQNRWTDFLATALNSSSGLSDTSALSDTSDLFENVASPTGVLNLGIGGNCVIEGGLSEPALKRFDRDILGQQGVRTLIIFEGTNDIGCSPSGRSELTTQRLIEAYQTLIAKAHQADMKVYMATITPFKGNGWYSFFHEAARQTVNEWIRTQKVSDGIIDFDQLVRDPNDKERLKAEYSDDWLHLNPTGYEAMGKYAATIIKEGKR